MRPDRVLQRRTVLWGGAAVLSPGLAQAAIASSFQIIEDRVGGRLGVFARDMATGRSAAFRADERFPTASTFKALLAAVVLQRVDSGREQLDRAVRVPAAVLSNSPVTGENTGRTMTVEQLCSAIVRLSDNTGANLLLDSVGGPGAFTRALRAMGDRVTRLDRYELALNEALPGDPRDTTSPRAVARNAERLLLRDVLSTSSRARLSQWMVESPTGVRRIRAGVPAGWRVADKTGTGARGTTNDFGVIWPPRGGPIALAVYLTGSAKPLAEREAAIAETTRAALAELGRA